MSKTFSLNIPPNWITLKLEDIGRWGSGGTPRKGIAEYYGGDIPWLKIADLNDGLVKEAEERITELGLKASSAKLLPPSVLLVAMYGSIGKLGITGIHCATNQAIAFCYPNIDLIDLKYLFWLLRNSKNELTAEGKGGTQQNISQTVLKAFEIPLPPLNEQRRIVAEIEALKARSQQVKEALEAIPPLLDQFRQSVLAAAFRGDLTADWREKNPDVEPASDLLERIQEERKKRYKQECEKAQIEGRRKPKDQTKNNKSVNLAVDLPDIPPNWAVARLEDISYLVTDGTHKTPQYKSEGIPFLSVKNVRPFLIKDEDIKFISEEEHKEINARCNPEKEDILYTKVGATFGYAALNKLDYAFSIFVSLALIKPVHPFFFSEYAEAVMNSEIVFSQAKQRVSGIGTPDLHLIEIRDFRIPLPPIEEQQEIVRRVKSLLKVANYIKQQHQEIKAHVDQLDQSILAKAFRGELVPQDPNDEPASVLLERIQAEREKREAGAKTAKKSTGKTTGRRSRKAKQQDTESIQLGLPGLE